MVPASPAVTAPYIAPDGTEVTIGTAKVINADNIELPVHCLASPSGSCVFMDGGGGTGLFRTSGSAAEPLSEEAQVAYGGGALYPLFHPGVSPNLYPLVLPVGSSGTILFRLAARNSRGYEQFLRLRSVVAGVVVCSLNPCVVTKYVVTNPEFPPTAETNGAPAGNIGTAALDLSHAEPPPPTYVYFSRLTVWPDGEATITLRCTSSHLLRGDCIVTDLGVEAPGGHTPDEREYRSLFLRRSVVIERGGEKTARLYYWRNHDAAGSPDPSSSQRGIWSGASKAAIGAGICDSRRRGCRASPFNAYGNAEITAELIQLESPEVPPDMAVSHG